MNRQAAKDAKRGRSGEGEKREVTNPQRERRACAVVTENSYVSSSLTLRVRLKSRRCYSSLAWRAVAPGSGGVAPGMPGYEPGRFAMIVWFFDDTSPAASR